MVMLAGMLQVVGAADDVYASEEYLRVDGDLYDMSQDQQGEGWTFLASNAELTLDNYNGGFIYRWYIS